MLSNSIVRIYFAEKLELNIQLLSTCITLTQIYIILYTSILSMEKVTLFRREQFYTEKAGKTYFPAFQRFYLQQAAPTIIKRINRTTINAKPPPNPHPP
jgi:hypothetical protein